MRRRFKVLALIATVTGLIGCSPPPAQVYGAYPAWRSDVADADCASGFRLKASGFCTDDNPDLFGAATVGSPQSDLCQWRLAEAEVSAEAVILFRATTCKELMARRGDTYVPAERPRPLRYFHVPRQLDTSDVSRVHELIESVPSSIATIDHFVVTIVELSPGETAQDFALGWRSPDLQPGKPLPKCKVVRRTDIELAGEGFALAAEDGSQVCSEGVIWEARPSLALLHYEHGLGSSLDHLSYTLYVHQPDGRWVRRA